MGGGFEPPKPPSGYATDYDDRPSRTSASEYVPILSRSVEYLRG